MRIYLGRTGQLTMVALSALIVASGASAQDGSNGAPYGQPQQQQNYPQGGPGQYGGQPNQYPPSQGQPYPQGGQQYPPQAQYPDPQGQYPPAQGGYGAYAPPPLMPPDQLNNLVSSVALYPDGLLAQVLTASTFYNDIPPAAAWANQHSYLNGPALAQAIQQDGLPWNPSVLALLPFPNVLNQLANNMGWTQALGNEVLSQRAAVMDAVQRMRQQAYDFGYLRSNSYERITPIGPGQIEIVPVQPDYYYVPYYNPVVVFSRPRPGFFVGSAIRFGPGIVLGANFAPFGWGGAGFGWREHTILIDHHTWDRNWNNRGAYAHPYVARPHYEAPRAEHHELRGPDHYDHHDRR